AAAGREPGAVGARRRARPRARRRGTRPADSLHIAVHEPDRRDHARPVGARLHAGRVDRDGAAVCLGAAAAVPARSRGCDGGVGRGGGGVGGGRGRGRTQRLLVVSQLAVSFMLLIGAGLLTRSLYTLYAIDPGFNLSNVLSLQAPDFTQAKQERRQQFSRDLLERVHGQPAVQGAAVASAAPLAGSFPQQQEFRIDGADADALASAPKTVTRIVSSEYFKTVGTPITVGRAFASSDLASSARVVIVSESMGRYYFRNQNPIGRRISWKGMNGPWTAPAEIVGVAADSRADGLTQTPLHTLYQPDTQAFAPSTILVRTGNAPDSIAPRVIETIRALDPNRPIDHVQTLEEIRDDTI